VNARESSRAFSILPVATASNDTSDSSISFAFQAATSHLQHLETYPHLASFNSTSNKAHLPTCIFPATQVSRDQDTSPRTRHCTFYTSASATPTPRIDHLRRHLVDFHINLIQDGQGDKTLRPAEHQPQRHTRRDQEGISVGSPPLTLTLLRFCFHWLPGRGGEVES
jgi:hypothetical protein